MTSIDLLRALGSTLLPLGAFWVLFRLVLQHERCYRYNRALLLLAPVVALGLPLLPLPTLPQWLAAAPVPTPALATVLLPALSAGPAPAAPLQWPAGLLALYGLGVLLGLARLGWQLARLRRVARRLPCVAEPGYALAYTGGALPTSSFGRTVYWDETAPLPPDEARAVLAHEVAHVRQGHSYDVLWLEAWRALLWFNPFAHLLLPALRLTHELLADEAAAGLGTPAALPYTALLARQALGRVVGVGSWPLLQPFHFSFTLTRIAMLQNQIPVRRWKQWLVLPVLGGLLVAACQKTQEPPAPKAGTEPETITSAPIRRGDEVALRQVFRQLWREDSLRNGKLGSDYGLQFEIKKVPGQPDMAVVAVHRAKTSLLPTGQHPSTNEPKVYTYVEQMPQLPGKTGTAPIVQAIQANLTYPKGADGKLLPAGVCFASFTVGTDGAVQDSKIIKSAGLNPTYDTAVLDAIGKLPRFEPGREGGKAVAVSFTVPVRFQPQP